MKENKLTILLNDKDLLSELIKDKDVQVRIKDAVIDGIGRRAIKLINNHEDFKSGIKIAVRNMIFDRTRYVKFSEVFEPLIQSEVQKHLEDYIKKSMSQHINNVVENHLQEIYAEVKRYNQGLSRQILAQYDIEKMIKTEIDNTVTRIIHRINENTKENQ